MGDHALASPSQLPAEAAPKAPPGFNFNLLIAVGVASFFSGVGGTLLIYAVARGGAGPVATTAPTSDPAPVLASAPSSAAPVAPASASPFSRTGKTDPASPEVQARSALTRLRDGIGVCVRDVIGVLPGTSPPVPLNFKLMKSGVYTSLSSDFRSPVFACARYKETEPQAFQIQWQRGGAPSEGTGVAWIDDDHDGVADRAFGFRAKLVKKNDVTLGDITPLDPMPKVLPAR